ncbi:ribbon-helix-helix domain-containing protein [Halorhodospira sp. 9621]|uniref:ribbon-helix-helix domain-containing protein n=1 Tax=Halorhodospira TaxID=85108 RepID=UPI001EE846A1|nr:MULTISPECIES: CopG family transcriptional regulator [Halorhodospira]MCG5528519.1 ribbon-helix-helix domain-containing protein [Halorhodospira halophila]MCG5533823.1 ribbon-helix-helix domain-containing protein [Halorhodospira sp. 9621]MCG5537456.1 ribbon-helix-helix domain-containing protein [Halorhodospira sp. 9622]MCG5543818.1 ribbon-helix-helix domain-containing protein [Halorhodospira sp. 9628]
MRTTLDIDPDILEAAKELARRRNCSTDQVVSEAIRQALERDRNPERRPVAGVRVGGFRPFPARSRPVTNADVEALRDEEGE